MGRRYLTQWVILLGAVTACHHATTPEIPGHTEISVAKVDIVATEGESLDLNYGELKKAFGLRPGNALLPARDFNPYRLAEDARRLHAFLHMHGRFDSVVAEPQVNYTDNGRKAEIVHQVAEGIAYTVNSIKIRNAPEEHLAELEAMLPFSKGDELEFTVFRPLRRELAEALQRRGFGHARVFSRTYVNRRTKKVDWHYFVDAGPKTRIRSIKVEGNRRLPADLILARAGLKVGSSYGRRVKEQTELALLDSGAFTSVAVIDNGDILRGPPEFPDTGGVLTPQQVSASGDLIPRNLESGLDVRIRVVEAPAKQVRLEAGLEADPSRSDAYVGGRLIWRDFFAPQHHLSLRGQVGYGYFFDGGNRRAYGDVRAEYSKASFLHPRLDFRLAGRYRDSLFPTASMREVSAGPGVRTMLGVGLFADLDVHYVYSKQLDLGPFDQMVADDLSLTSAPTSERAEIRGALVLDRRNDKVEASDGHFVALRSEYSPGGAVGDHRFVRTELDGRYFLPVSRSWSLAARANGGVIAAANAGVPLGSRFFGGGAYGMRGYGRQQLATAACAMAADGSCDEELVGGMSLAQASLEARFLPFRQLYGLAAFADVGGVGAASNPFEDGVSAALGLGLRIRTWYVPISVTSFSNPHRWIHSSSSSASARLSNDPNNRRRSEARRSGQEESAAPVGDVGGSRRDGHRCSRHGDGRIGSYRRWQGVCARQGRGSSGQESQGSGKLGQARLFAVGR
jgi:outer membrane protein assembly factor BamA